MATRRPAPPPLADFVERLGLIWEAQGLPRIAGRIVGYLTLQAEPLSLDAIATALGVSKASVSGDARYLARLGLIELTTRRGDRRDYYVIAPDMPLRMTEQKLAEIERLHVALRDAAAAPGLQPVARERIRSFGDFQLRIVESVRALMETMERPARTAIAFILLALTACGGGETTPDGATGGADSTAAARAMVLSAADVTTVTTRDVTTGIILTGSLEPATTVTLTAQVGGTIAQLGVDRGSAVRSGQLLATITAEGVRSQAAGARANVAAAESNLAVLRTRRDAARRLLAAGAISQVDADNAESAYQAAEAQVAAAKAQATVADEMSGFTAVRAPLDGVVSERAVEQGEPIAVGDPVLTIVDTRMLELAGRVPVDEAGAVRVGQPVTFTLDAFPDRTFTGSVHRKDPTASASDRQVGVYVRLPNARGELVAGQYARGEVAGRAVRGALTVPSTAVQGSGAEAAVFVIEANKLVRRPVTLGARDAVSGVVAITQGLAAGDRVLVRPVPGLTDGQPVTLAADR